MFVYHEMWIFCEKLYLKNGGQINPKNYWLDHFAHGEESNHQAYGLQDHFQSCNFKPIKAGTSYFKLMFTILMKYNWKNVSGQILEMPYKGNDLSMLIFLPNEIEDDTTGLEKVGQIYTHSKPMHKF